MPSVKLSDVVRFPDEILSDMISKLYILGQGGGWHIMWIALQMYNGILWSAVKYKYKEGR